MSSDSDLVEAATQARGRAIAHITNYQVGAAVRTRSGDVFTGCNIENIVLGDTVCAEKVAMYKALEAGARDFETMAVSTVSSPPASPCGSCRQLMMHWGVKRVVSANGEGEIVEWTLAELLPDAFVL